MPYDLPVREWPWGGGGVVSDIGAACSVVRTWGARPMKIYEFSLIASGLDPESDDFESRFYDAGCDDATVSFQKGHIILDFAREAETAAAAIWSAVENARCAGATIDRVEPDPLVSLTEDQSSNRGAGN